MRDWAVSYKNCYSLRGPNYSLQEKRFLASYKAEKTGNRFTKVTMDAKADAVLQAYFKGNQEKAAAWFNVIAPAGRSMDLLKEELNTLNSKEWGSIYGL